MKTITISFLLIFGLLNIDSFSQSRHTDDDENGDWTEQYVTLFDTPEAAIMVRSGDIDNLGFGWPAEFNPFSGNSTPSHGYPWTADSTDASGTDRIMVISSYDGSPPSGQDGYTTNTSRPENLPRAILLTYDLAGIQLETAVLQIFVDDFQASSWGANYFVTINGVDAPYIADIVNVLNQTGPIGKIINVTIPEEHLYLLESDSLSTLFDDTITGAGDGYAIDFVKLLMNLKGFTYTAKVYGGVTDAGTGIPIKNAIVTASGTGEILSDEDGYYIFKELPAGINTISATKFGYDTVSVLIDLKAGDSIRQDFELNEILDAEFIADEPNGYDIPHTVNFTDLTSMEPTEWYWDFGDGMTSTEQHPTHDYASAGVFTVSLTASTGEETNTETKIGYIDVILEGVEEYNVISGLKIGPNPATKNTTISFSLTDARNVSIDIYDLTGKVARSIHDQHHQSGDFKIPCVLVGLLDGIYFIHLQAGESHLTRKITVMH